MRQQLKSLLDDIKNNKLLIVGFMAALAALVLVNGFLPNMVGLSLPSRLDTIGRLDCAADNPASLVSLNCPVIGGDSEAVAVVGAPFNNLGFPFIYFLGMSAQWAFFVVATIFMSLALFGSYKLIRVFGVNRYISLLFGFLYLLTPLVTSMQSFGGTFWGALLLPLYIYSAYCLLGLVRGANFTKSAIILLAWTFLCSFELFMDGYTFVMANAAVAAIVFIWSWGKWRYKDTWLGIAIYALALALAYGIFTSIVPGSGDWRASLGIFRSMSLDPFTALLPTSSLWWVELTNFRLTTGTFWGDGTNWAYNYVGYSVILVALIGIYGVFRAKKQTNKSKEHLKAKTIAVLLVLAGSFTLSLGPSLKWNSVRPPLESPITHKSYLMPNEAAVLNLPTDVLFKHAPGLRSMRAIYRWHLLTMLMIYILAAIGLQFLIDKKLYKISILLAVIALFELAPNPVSSTQRNLSFGNRLDDINTRVIDPLNKSVGDAETIVFYPAAIDGNDYMANYIAPLINTKTYNVGGDKAVDMARQSRPDSIYNLLKLNDKNRATTDGDLVKKVLQQTEASAIVVPYFDLRWDSYSWNSRSFAGKERAMNFLSRISNNPDFIIDKHELFSVVRLSQHN